jgi:phospholipid/cholesterol/gamma-HCH transport system substrate-binding protein
MSPYRRNILVGITVLAALGTLGWMIIRFGGSLGNLFAGTPRNVTFLADRSDGIFTGSVITYRGVEVGRVLEANLNAAGDGVVIRGQINEKSAVPAKVKGSILITSLLGGGGSIVLTVTDPADKTPIAEGAQVPVTWVGSTLLPPELTQTATEIGLTVKQFRESNIIGDFKAQLERVGKTLDSVEAVVGDPRVREDLKQAVANARQVTERANAIAADVQKVVTDLAKTSEDARGMVAQGRTTLATADTQIRDIGQQVGGRLTELSQLLTRLQSVVNKVDQGQGTAGQLVNDPKLYQALVDTTADLNATIKDLQRLVRQWEQEGVTLKVR